MNNLIAFSTLNVDFFFFLKHGDLTNFRPRFMAQGKNIFPLGGKQLYVWIKHKTFK